MKTLSNRNHGFASLLPVMKGMLLLPLAIMLVSLATARFCQADEADAAADFSAEVEIGGLYGDSQDDRSFIRPYDPLDSSVFFGFDLFSINPGGGTIDLGGEFSHEDNWNAEARYNKGASFSVGARAQKFYHAQQHRKLPPDFEEAAVPPAGSVHVVSSDEDPDKEFFSTFEEYSADFRLRAPSYPAHLSGNARIYKKEGDNQMLYFFRTCSTHICHPNSATREIDQETREYNIGFDSHVGAVDIAYNRNFLTFSDDAQDPTDFFGDFNIGRSTPGVFPHHVNSDVKSFTDEIKLNTNLTNRMVFSVNYSGGESENEDNGLVRDGQRAVANLSYTRGRRHFLSLRYVYDNVATKNVSEEVRALREKIGDDVEPDVTENSGEITYRFVPSSALQLHGHLRHSAVTRDNFDASEISDETRTTTADLDIHYRVCRTIKLEGEIARDWISDPLYATDFTRLWRYMVGADWTPTPVFSFLARYTGSTGENDSDEALGAAYYNPLEEPDGFSRDQTMHNVLALATITPDPSLVLTAAYSYSLNDIEQDQFLGSTDDAGFFFLSENSPLESRYQILNLDVAWKATTQLTLSAGGMVIAAEETYEPEVAGRPELTAGISDGAKVEFTKFMATAGGEYDFTNSLGVALTGFWADFNDMQDDDSDGTGGGVLVTVKKKW